MNLNLGCGSARYEEDTINLDIIDCFMTDVDILATAKKIPFKDESFEKVFFFQTLEHIERNWHGRVFDEIWRILKKQGMLLLTSIDAVEVMQRFIDNKYGRRWEWYNRMLFGRQLYGGDYHVTAIERHDLTDRLLSAGFIDIDFRLNQVDIIVKTIKGEKMPEYI